MPAPDHPWYGPRGKLKQPGRTISDELNAQTAEEMRRQAMVGNAALSDDDLRSARDPSYSPMTEGAAMRKPVRYD